MCEECISSNIMDDRLQQKKLYFMNETLRELHGELDFEIQSKIPLENLLQIGKFVVSFSSIS